MSRWKQLINGITSACLMGLHARTLEEKHLTLEKILERIVGKTQLNKMKGGPKGWVSPIQPSS